MSSLATYFGAVSALAASVPVDKVQAIVDLIRRAWIEGRTVFLMGNGGSAATASHLATDFAKGTFGPERPRLRVVSLTDNVSLLTAWANDTSYERVFAEQVADLVGPGDVVIAISASGNSPNVLVGVQTAKELGATTVGLTGFQGGRLVGLVDHCVIVPSDNMQLIEDAHMWIGHAIFCELRDGSLPK